MKSETCFFCKQNEANNESLGGGHPICKDCYTNGYDPRPFVQVVEN